MNEREQLGQVKCRSVDGDLTLVSVYRIGDRLSLVASIEHDGDYEVLLEMPEAEALSEMLKKGAS